MLCGGDGVVTHSLKIDAWAYFLEENGVAGMAIVYGAMGSVFEATVYAFAAGKEMANDDVYQKTEKGLSRHGVL